jgi:Domain of unknown function (DUF1876)
VSISTSTKVMRARHVLKTARRSWRRSRQAGDANSPEIGDEVAVALALRGLADRLLATASDDMSAVEGRTVHIEPCAAEVAGTIRGMRMAVTALLNFFSRS